VDDPTIRRCKRFARDWGYGSLWVANIFAFRATDPIVMKLCAAPIGARNNEYLLSLGRSAGIVIAAWGTHGGHRGRQAEVIDMMTRGHVPLHHLGLTKHGFPKHPLYLPLIVQPQPWTPKPWPPLRAVPDGE